MTSLPKGKEEQEKRKQIHIVGLDQKKCCKLFDMEVVLQYYVLRNPFVSLLTHIYYLRCKKVAGS